MNLPTGTVTFLFTDIEGSTRLAQQYRDAWEALRKRHHAILREAIEAQNGYVFQIVGDAFCAAFSTAEEAVRAAAKAQIDLNAEKWIGGASIKVRMGIHTGKAKIEENGEYHGYLAMSRVQRLVSVAHGGQILVSLAAQNQVFDDLPENVTLRDMGEHRLKDIIQPEHIYQLIIPGLAADFPPLKTLVSSKQKPRMGLAVRLIGTFEIKFDNKPVNISSRIAQSLFAYLILNAGKSQRRERLAGLFWPDETEEKARTYLRHELWRIRKALSAKSKVDYIIADKINVSFDSSADYWLDVDVLQNVGEISSEGLINALSLFAGELLPGFYEDWIITEREHLQAVYEQKMARLLELLEKEKHWTDILEWAEHWISLGQGPEAAYRSLMIAYDALGDRAMVASTYQRCIQALRALDLEPSEQTRALAFKRRYSLNIPIPMTSFIGREKEVKEVADLLSKSRLVTLTGSGGVGKTRLAIQVVADILDSFPDGVWFLDLAPLSDPALVPYTLANLFGLREPVDPKLSITDLLKGYLRSRTALIIYDNCEHVIESCAQLVNSLLNSCENLTILATSREALRVSGEIPYRIPSLQVPSMDDESAVDALEKTESVRLFIERAATISPGFAIGSQNAHVIAQICQRLDGIPLAIELAAARTNILTVEQISSRLSDRFNLLTRGLRTNLPRHQTLRETIEWSYGLLSQAERLLFRRLAVFTGGWTLEAAEEVCSGNGIESTDVMDLLSQLVNKSLVMVESQDAESRYRRLETIRQFAREKLFETGEATQLQDMHLEFFSNLAETAEPHLRRTEQIEWLKRLDAEHENLRAALAWAMGKPSAASVLRLTGSLGTFWEIRAYWLEAARWLDQALGKPWNEDSKAEKVARAKALYRRADIAEAIDEPDIMKRSAESALALCEQVEDAWGIAFSRFLIWHSQRRSSMPKATTRFSLEQSLREFQNLGDAWGESLTMSWLAMVMLDAMTREEFFKTMQRAIARACDSGDRGQIAFSLKALALDPFNHGEWDEADRLLQEAEKLYGEINPSDTGASLVRHLRVQIFFALGNFEKAKADAKLVIENREHIGEKYQQRMMMTVLALIAEAENDLSSAVAYAQRAVELSNETQIMTDIVWNLMLVGKIKYQQENFDPAKRSICESLEFARMEDISQDMVVGIFDHLAGLFVEKKSQSAVRILAFAESLVRSSNVRRDLVFDKPYFDRYLSAARAHLSEAEFASAWEAGSKMSLDEAIAYTLKELE